MQKPFISIILPVYNQGRFIASIVEQYEQALAVVPADRELLLVVNGSSDNSREVCEDLSQRFTSVRVLHSETGGWGKAVKLGIRESRGNLICYTNSARTKAKDLILFLLYAIANPDSVIKANRKIRDSSLRRLGSLLYNIECRILFDLSNWDINGTPKIFPRRYSQLLELQRDDDLIDVEFCYLCKKENYPMLEVPALFPERQGGKSTTGIKSALKMYWRVLGYARNLRELSS